MRERKIVLDTKEKHPRKRILGSMLRKDARTALEAYTAQNRGQDDAELGVLEGKINALYDDRPEWLSNELGHLEVSMENTDG